jgi:membrane associated rhomboid family serine protease
MASTAHDFMMQLLKACAERAPEPLYPAIFARESNLDRDKLDVVLDELRRRGLIKLTDWAKDLGQGRALTEAGWTALKTNDLAPVVNDASAPTVSSTRSTYQRGEMVRNAVFKPQEPLVCWILITLNVLFFLYGAFYAWQHHFVVTDYLSGTDGIALTTTKVVRELGGLYRPDVLPEFNGLRPEFERIVLCCFLHFGVIHLGINMISLATLGGLVESMWGKLRFLAIYLIAGLVGSCVVLSIDLIQPRNALSAGASGSVCGVFASMLVWVALNRRHLPDQFLHGWSRTLAINLFIVIGINMVPGISWQGHLGGAIGGALAACLLHVQRFHANVAVRLLALFGLPMIPALFFLLVLWQAGWV